MAYEGWTLDQLSNEKVRLTKNLPSHMSPAQKEAHLTAKAPDLVAAHQAAKDAKEEHNFAIGQPYPDCPGCHGRPDLCRCAVETRIQIVAGRPVPSGAS